MIKKLLLVRTVPLLLNVACLLFISPINIKAAVKPGLVSVKQDTSIGKRDTLMTDTLDAMGLEILGKLNQVTVLKNVPDTLNIDLAQTKGFISLQQMLKGKVAGLYVQETSGEPGTVQSMILRGLSSPVFNDKDSYSQQAVVYLNGIPLIQDHPFAYDIQKYDYNRIGPATNILTALNLSDISSVEVIKDPVELAKLGPLASNGAIWINTKNATSGKRQISINSYFSMVEPNNITPTNAHYEDQFRKPFYNKYASSADKLSYSAYLRDSTNASYYGPSQWDDLYYSASPAFSADLSITGGSERANFRFFGGATQNAGNADDAKLQSYNASFYINMAPSERITISSMVKAARLDRDRNRSLRDRYAETRYLPDLTTPLPPNKEIYQQFLNEYEKSIDNNINNIVQGYISVNVDLNKVKFNSKFSFDYNEGLRDVFWPSTLMETNNFVSNYFGYNQRILFSNTLSYDHSIDQKHNFRFEGGQVLQVDAHKYNYALAYDGPSDFIKINVVEGDANKPGYLTPVGFRTNRYTDKLGMTMLSFYGSANYNFDNKINISGLLRTDGSSYNQPDSRWFLGSALGAKFELLDIFSIKPTKKFNSISAGVSLSRTGVNLMDDRYASGPQYRVDLGWSDEPAIPSYDGMSGLSRPYTQGWVGYDVKWPYVDKINFSLNSMLFNNRLNAAVSLYSNTYTDLLMNIPTPAEYGYTGAHMSGMKVNNKGVELILSGDIINKADGFKWTSAFNGAINQNKLLALPDGLDEIIIGDRKLKVGESIDKYWLFQNEGIYNNESEIPASTNGEYLTYNGSRFNVGDPRWKDLNGDYVVNDKDRVLTGNSVPKFTGGLMNSLSYKNFNLDVNLNWATGHHAINQYASDRYDFINRESMNEINSIMEINFWQQNLDITKYPIYNTWSDVVPYRAEQDLFMESLSYLKIRSLTFGYKFENLSFIKGGNSNKSLQLYLTGTNLYTFSNFSGSDPELVNFAGYYTGYGLPIPRTFILGFKLNL